MKSVFRPAFGPWPSLLAVAFFCLLLAGCNRDKIKVYRVGKEAASQPANLPEGWTAAAPGQMRVASYSVKGNGKQADVSVIPLPGAAGGAFANVNRWRGQVGLPPATENEIKQSAEAIQVSGQPAELYDIAGTNAANGEAVRILAGIQNRDDTAWFFKMTGDDQLVAHQKPLFIAFLKTFDATVATASSSGTASSLPPFDPSALPPGHPDISMMPVNSGEVSHAGQPKWEVPSGWKEVPAGQFLVAKFLLNGGDGTEAAVNVSASAGDGGGLAANVNRWRGQLALTALSTDDLANSLQTLDASGAGASLVEMSGTDGQTGLPAKLVAIIVPQPDQTWFYKLMGNAKVVDSQKEAFLEFVQSVKY